MKFVFTAECICINKFGFNSLLAYQFIFRVSRVVDRAFILGLATNACDGDSISIHGSFNNLDVIDYSLGQ